MLKEYASSANIGLTHKARPAHHTEVKDFLNADSSYGSAPKFSVSLAVEIFSGPARPEAAHGD